MMGNGENTCSFCGWDEDYGFPNGYCCERIACSNCSNVNAGDEEDMCILCSLLYSVRSAKALDWSLAVCIIDPLKHTCWCVLRTALT